MKTPIKLPNGFRPPQQRERIFARAVGARSRVSAADNPTVIEIFDEIGKYGVSAVNVSSALRLAGGKPVTIRINSPGGDIFEGTAIYNLINQYSGGTRIEVLGLAASAASLIAMAGDKIAVAANSSVMIHKAWALVIGNEADCLEMAGVLAQLDANMADTYASRTGLDAEVVAELMQNETWFNGRQAVENGFADEILGEEAVAASFDLSLFRNAPDGLGVSSDAAVRVNSVAELANLLQRAGLPKTAAMRAATRGFDGLKPEDDKQSAEIANLIQRLDAATASLPRFK